MAFLDTNSTRIHWTEFGNPNGPAIVFSHGMGVNSTIWKEAISSLKSLAHCRIITYDLRGHGASQAHQDRGTMGALVRDAESLMDALNLSDIVFVGHGLGGMIAQGLAIKRLDLVRGLVLVNTSAKLGNKEQWATQIDDINTGGAARIAEDLWARWFSKSARDNPLFAPWKNVLHSTPPQTFIAALEAISGTDFYTPVSGLGLPTLGLSAYNDRVFPPDLMRETLDLIKGADFQLLPRVGHLPMVENPKDFAARLDVFLLQVGHQSKPAV